MLLEMLTVQADQNPIYARDLGALQDQVNAMQNQMNTLTEECNAAEAAICLLCTELVEARNVANCNGGSRRCGGWCGARRQGRR